MRELSSASMARGVSPFAALQRAEIFEGMEQDELNEISAAMVPRSFKAGEELFHEGEPAGGMFVIVDGLVRVLAPGASEDDPEVVARLRRGDVVGATALVTGEPRTVTALAGMPTDALELGKRELDALVERHPRILVNLNRILNSQLVRSNLRASRSDERGEAVALIVGPSLLDTVPDILEATMAAGGRPVASVDTRIGFDAAVAQLDELLQVNGTVVLVARAEGSSAPLLLDHADRAVVLVEDPGEAEHLRRPEGAALGRDRIEVIEIAPGLPPADVAWLGRHLSRTKLGLALGAGGAKGYAHVGALQVLEDAGYTIDYVAGSSIGAIVATYVALGRTAAEIDATLRAAFTEEAVADMFKLSLSGKSTGRDTIERILRQTTGESSFEDTLIPLVVMSADLNERDAAPIREGPLWEALMAATALAGMFPPYEGDGRRLVDGLALVPVPTGSVAEDGADVTVSVNLMSRDTLSAWPGEEGPPAPAERPGSRMLATLLEVMDLMQLDKSVRHAAAADVVITPRFGPGTWRDFHLADQFLAAGRQAAEDQLAALTALARPQFASAND